MANWGGAGSGAAKGAAIGTSIMPGWGTAIGAGVGFFSGLFKKKSPEQQAEEYNKTAQAGGYITVPEGGIPGHPEWKPGTRQWIPPGSPTMDATGKIGGMGAGSSMGSANIDYGAIRDRAIAPSRAVYQNALRNLRRQPGMGMTSPGHGAQLLALSRGMSNDISEAATTAEAGIANTRLQELGQQQQYSLGQRGLDIEEKKLPSGLSKGLSTTNQVLDLVGKGADIYAGYKT